MLEFFLGRILIMVVA